MKSEKLRCAIVDDEPLAIDVLKTYVGRLDGYEVVGAFTSPVKAFEYLQAARVDVVFLDIHMPEMEGFDLLKSLPYKPQVVIVTAHRDRAIDGFEFDVVDFLLKPVPFERFLRALSKLSRQNGSAAHEGQGETAIELPSDRQQVRIEVSDILYCESLDDYLLVHTVDRTVKSYRSLRHVQRVLPDFFVRIHRSFIVNERRVTAYDRNRVWLGDTEIPVGKSFKGKRFGGNK